MRREDHRHHAFYCEENVWWLAQSPEAKDGHVVFATNRQRQLPYLEQRAGRETGLVAWDYHVWLLDGAGRVLDLDTKLPFPSPLREYLDGSFGLLEDLGPVFDATLRPRFRPVDVGRFIADFGTDRGHMRREDGSYLHPPPPWDPPSGPWDLGALLSFDGEPAWLDQHELLARFDPAE